MSSALENLFAMQLDSAGLTQYVREYRAIPGRKFRFDFAFLRERLLVEINGGTYNGGAHGRGVGINRDYEKGNLAVVNNWRVLSFDTKQVKSGAALEVVEQLINQSNRSNEMNLYLITRNDRVGYDEYDAAVIAAETEEAAKSFIVDGNEIWGWTRNYSSDPKNIDISIKLIGVATPDIEAGILIASFNAG